MSDLTLDSVLGEHSLIRSLSLPLMTREAFAAATGLPLGVLLKQADRGYWPQIRIGRRVFINVEAVRLMAVQKHNEFARA